MIPQDVIDELNEAKRKMGKEWILDIAKIHNDGIFGTDLFATNFSFALNEFKMVDTNDKAYFENACEEFSKYYNEAQVNHWIIKKPELERCEECSKELEKKKEEVNQLNEKINELNGKLKNLESEKRSFTSEVEPEP